MIHRPKLLLVTLACSILLFASMAAARNSDPEFRIPRLTQMASKAADQGTIRVLVELDVANIETYVAASTRIKAGQGGLDKQWRAAAADAALKTRIAATADNLLNRLDSGGARLLRRYDAFPLVALEVTAETLEELGRSSLVRHVAEDRLSKPFLDDTVHITGASAAWSGGDTGAGWSVAILDTGILSSHQFFEGKNIVEACFSVAGHCPNGQISMTGAGAASHHSSSYPGYDHGTHVAGIAAGNSGSRAGVARDADIIAVQVFSRFDDSPFCDPEDDCILSWTSDQIRALDYVYFLRTTTNIAAVNLSLGGGAYSSICDDDEQVYKLAVDQLRDVGIATIAASGNAGKCNAIAAPACISSVISVGATEDDDAMTVFSNYQVSLLDIFAPGQAITSSVASSTTGYASWSGTSMATPHVAGAFALLRQKESVSSVGYLLDTLMETGDPVTGSDHCGTGEEVLPIVRIRVDAAISLIAQKPAAPGELAATADGGDGILLTWMDNAANALGFTIERSVGDNADYSQIASLGAGITNYMDSTLSEGTTYFYRVRAYNSHGNSEFCPEADATIPLAAPDKLVGTAVSPTRIDLTWTDNSIAESGFDIERAIQDGSTFSRIARVDADVESYSDTSGLEANTTYYYRIRSSNPSIASSYSNHTHATTPVATLTRDSGGGGGGGGGCFISVAVFE